MTDAALAEKTAGQPDATANPADVKETPEAKPTPEVQPNAADLLAPQKTWYDDLSDELRADKTIQRFDGKNPQDLATAYLEVRKMIGTDKGLMPKDGDDITKWDGWTKLGALNGVEAYKEAIKPPEMPEGVDFDQAGLDALIAVADRTRAPQHVVQAIVDDMTQVRLAAIEQEKVREADDARELATLQKSWGLERAAKTIAAQRAAKYLGFDEADLGALTRSLGSAGIVDKLATLGASLNEDGLVGAGDNVLGITEDEAKAELEEMKRNRDIVKALTEPDHPDHKKHTERRKVLMGYLYT